MNKQQLLGELRKEGFSEDIINAFSKIPREDFVSGNYKKEAYENYPLSIGERATISQPYTIAFMLDLLELNKLADKNDKVKILEIGSGSGYVLALIDEICKNLRFDYEISGIEINKQLVGKSREILRDRNIRIIQGNGSKGVKGRRFDRILVSAAFDKTPSHLFNQLKRKGILVSPVGNSIIKVKKKSHGIEAGYFPGFVFVPLVDS